MRLFLGIALAVSLSVNAWLCARPRAAAPVMSASTFAFSADDTSAPTGSASFAGVARAIEQSKRARAVGDIAGQGPADVDARGAVPDAGQGSAAERWARDVADVQCRVARDKAAEAWRKEGEGIRKGLVSYQEPSDEARASSLVSEKDMLADVIGTEPDDARVSELADKRMELQRDTLLRWRDALTGDPPDWRTGVDILLDYYRRVDIEGLRVLGVEKAADVHLADIDDRAALLAIGASLMDAPWESVVVP
jgi:hypothetical protein